MQPPPAGKQPKLLQSSAKVTNTGRLSTNKSQFVDTLSTNKSYLFSLLYAPDLIVRLCCIGNRSPIICGPCKNCVSHMEPDKGCNLDGNHFALGLPIPAIPQIVLPAYIQGRHCWPILNHNLSKLCYAIHSQPYKLYMSYLYYTVDRNLSLSWLW